MASQNTCSNVSERRKRNHKNVSSNADKLNKKLSENESQKVQDLKNNHHTYCKNNFEQGHKRRRTKPTSSKVKTPNTDEETDYSNDNIVITENVELIVDNLQQMDSDKTSEELTYSLGNFSWMETKW